MKPKQNPTQPEAILLIRLKRYRAKEAMDKIVKRLGVISNEVEPGLPELLEYLTNMVYALELLLKVMANDWRTHRVGDMYVTIFGKPHAHPDFMSVLEGAILNQKFIYEPASRLLEHVPDLELLWDELTSEFYKRRWMDETRVSKEVVAPECLIQYLRDNLPRFHKSKTYQATPHTTKEQRIQMLNARIALMQAEVARLNAGESPAVESFDQANERILHEYVDSIRSAQYCFEYNSKIRNGEFVFGSWHYGKVLDGYLDQW